MAKTVKARTSQKPKTTTKVVNKQSEEKKTSKINIKKPDLSGLKKYNYQPILKIVALILVIISFVVLADLFVQFIDSSYSIAAVNGSRISKKEWRDKLEKGYGSAMASYLIEDKIIELEGKKEKIEISKDDVNKELDSLREQLGGEEQLQSALTSSNITLDELTENIKTNLLVKKLLEPTLEYTDDDVKNFFNQYSDVLFPTETAALEEGEKLDYEKYKEETKEKYITQLVSSNQTDWLSTKKTEYDIKDSTTEKYQYGFLAVTKNIVNSIFKK